MAVNEPVIIDGQRIIPATSVGVGVYPEDAENGEGLVKAADEAMYGAKKRGRNNIEFHTARDVVVPQESGE